MTNPTDFSAKDYLRPLKLGILFSVLGEAVIFLVWGVLLYSEGNLLHKFLWAMVFCGLGMGASIGALIDIWVVGKLNGPKAIMASVGISLVLLGLFCNFLCYRLDMHFNYFGGRETPVLFIWSGIIMSVIGGFLIGWLCFANKGKKILQNIGL